MRGRGERGATLIELVISIVVIAIAASAVLGVLSSTVGRSADAMVMSQAVAIAEAYLEEITLKSFADPDGVDGEAARPDFDDVDDYHGLVDNGARDQFGTRVGAAGAVHGHGDGGAERGAHGRARRGCAAHRRAGRLSRQRRRGDDRLQDALAMRARLTQHGFTLIELVVTLVISTIVVAFVSLFISGPVQGFADQARRVRLVDAADAALERIGRDVRRSLPNSVRTTSSGGVVALEMLSTVDGARYRAQPPGTADADPRLRCRRRLVERARAVHASREAVQLDEPLSRRLQRRRAGRRRLRARRT